MKKQRNISNINSVVCTDVGLGCIVAPCEKKWKSKLSTGINSPVSSKTLVHGKNGRLLNTSNRVWG